jgi:hypothetical protein
VEPHETNDRCSRSAHAPKVDEDGSQEDMTR